MPFFEKKIQAYFLQMQINRMQMDSQVPGATFPVILHPIPLPKSIAIDATPKPFIEVVLIQRSSENHTFTHIKNLQVKYLNFMLAKTYMYIFFVPGYNGLASKTSRLVLDIKVFFGVLGRGD